MVGDHNVLRGNCLQEQRPVRLQRLQPGQGHQHHDRGQRDHRQQHRRLGDAQGRAAAAPAAASSGRSPVRWSADNWIHDNHSAGAVGRHQQHRLRDRGQLHLRQPRRGHRLRDQLQRRSSGATRFVRNGLGKGPENSGFPTPARVHLRVRQRQAGGRAMFNQTFEISGNVFTDNWAGVILWENADRFSGSPANTSTGSGTLVNPKVVTVEDLQRDHHQQAAVPRRLPVEDPERARARQRLQPRPGQDRQDLRVPQRLRLQRPVLELGHVPGLVAVPEGTDDPGRDHASTRATSSTPTPTRGPWNFIVHEQGNRVNWAAWQGAPYGQDQDSVIKVQGER